MAAITFRTYAINYYFFAFPRFRDDRKSQSMVVSVPIHQFKPFPPLPAKAYAQQRTRFPLNLNDPRHAVPTVPRM